MDAEATGKARVRINGRERPLRAERLAELLAQLDIAADARGVAVALNGAVVPRSEWESRKLSPGDDVEIVGAVQGG
jgi:sulfur carrier protein